MKIMCLIPCALVCLSIPGILYGNSSDRYAPDSFEQLIEQADTFAVTDKIKSVDKKMLPAYRALAEKKKKEHMERNRTAGEWLAGAFGSVISGLGIFLAVRSQRAASLERLALSLLVTAIGANVVYRYWWYPAVLRQISATTIAQALQFQEEQT